MGFIFVFIGLAVALESHSTTPGIYVGTVLAIAGLFAEAFGSED